MKNKKSVISKPLLITCIVLTIIYTIIIIIPLFDFIVLTVTSMVDNETDLISKIMGLFTDLMCLGVLILPYYFLMEKVNKKKSICNAIIAEIVIGFSLCFFLWVMAPRVFCTSGDSSGGQWIPINEQDNAKVNKDEKNDSLICRIFNK